MPQQGADCRSGVISPRRRPRTDRRRSGIPNLGCPRSPARRHGRLSTSPPGAWVRDTDVVTDSFAWRFASTRRTFGPLVWGLDPSGELLETWGVGDTADGLDRFVDIVLKAAVGTV